MKKILFPTEFSNHAPEVFKYALEIAYFFKAKLVMLHAFGKPELQTTNDETIEHIANISIDKMIALVQNNLSTKEHKEVQIEYIAKVNFPAESILQVATEESINLIVMGMTSKTDAFETIFGSTVLEILAKADCPALVIPPKTKFKGIKHIVYAANFEFRDFAAINYLRKWTKVFDALLHCLHLIEKKENELNAMRNLKILKQTYSGKKRLLFDMKHGNFQEKIEDFARGKQADILVMMTHKRNFIERLFEKSAVKGVARHTHIPLLVIKDNPYKIDTDVAKWVEVVNSIA